jgi:hypothetical protein
MAYNREGYAPWSLTRKAGVQSATVNGDIEVPQYVQPVLDTGFVDEKGDWKGTKSSDEEFIISDTAVGIANGGEVLMPSTANADFIDMTGYQDIVIAIKPTNGGNCALTAVMGPATTRFANLTPVNEASTIKIKDLRTASGSLQDAFVDSAESLTADVWNIFMLQQVLANQKNMQLKIVNNSGGVSTIDFGYLRIV